MRLTVLGGWGAWPPAGGACSGYLLEHAGFRLLVDPGYATLPRLLELVRAEDVDAVAVTHGHPDHCADLNPLLRARSLGGTRPPALPVYGPIGALAPVLALDPPRMLVASYELHEFAPADGFTVGPFRVETAPLPHFVPNAGLRFDADGRAVAFTGDRAPDPAVTSLARGADLLVAEATFPERVPDEQRSGLSTAVEAGREAREAAVGRLLLTHLWPGTDPDDAARAASGTFPGPILVASGGLALEIG